MRRLRRFWRDLRVYGRQGGVRIRYRDLLPALGDWACETPVGYYFYQDVWAFQKVLQDRPVRHVDVGSTALLVGCMACVVPTVSVDIRPLRVNIPGLEYREGTITALPFPDGEVTSLSSLCVIEHIGLGRYGDPIDPEGSVKAGRELSRVLKPGGHLYASVPIGEASRVVFNAHRIFSYEDAVALFPGLSLREYQLVGNDGPLSSADTASASDFPVGLFHFTK
jgi:SAM-dependent methyltransferase